MDFLIVFFFQSKFGTISKLSDINGSPSQPGYFVEVNCVVLLNALGFIGFRVVTMAGTFKVKYILNREN